MEEEDRSDTDDEDSLASRTVVQNLELLTTTLRTYLRDEIGIVRDGVLKQSAVVESLVSPVQLEMRAFKALMEAMNGKIDRLTEENRALRVQTPFPAAASYIDTTSAAETETDGASNPAPTDEGAEGYLPYTGYRATRDRPNGDQTRATRRTSYIRPRGGPRGRARGGERLEKGREKVAPHW